MELAGKLPCTCCGTPILPATANRNGGLCAPCRNGSREAIDAAKQRYREERENPDPLNAYWQGLVDRVFASPVGFDSLNQAEKVYYAVNCLIGDVYNGGFDQYFWNSASSHYSFATRGLRILKANETLGLLESARQVVFVDNPVPVDTTQRREFLRNLGENGNLPSTISAELEALDSAFWEDPDRLSDRLRLFASESQFIA